MKKILFGLIVCALLVGMTGVVSADAGDYCKVTGGGTVVDDLGNDMGITVSFTAQGTCGSTEDVKGKVTIVDHTTKEKLQLDVVEIIECGEVTDFSWGYLLLDDCSILEVYDGGEGENAYYMDGVYYFSYWGAGYLSGNAQVKISPAI